MRLASTATVVLAGLALTPASASAQLPALPVTLPEVEVPALPGVGAESTTPSGDGGAGGSGGTTQTTQGTPPSKAKAYGRYCKGMSKKRVKGQKGTPFSRCVTAMSKLASGKMASPRKACGRMSRKRKARATRSDFSRCVAAGRKLRRERARR